MAGSEGGAEVVETRMRRYAERSLKGKKVAVQRSDGGGGLGGGHGVGTWWCGDGGGGGGDGGSPSLIFLDQPLERENTPFFLQMTSRVCGGVSSPLI